MNSNFKDFTKFLSSVADFPLVQIPLSVFLTGISILWIRSRAHYQWKNRVFLSRIGFSVQTLTKDGKVTPNICIYFFFQKYESSFFFKKKTLL